MVLNHIIVLNNVFGVEAACTLLLYKIDKPYYSIKTIFVYRLSLSHELNEIKEDKKITERQRTVMASRGIDFLITYRVVKLLVTPFEKQEAYKFGIIDDKGKVLKKYKSLKTEKERKSYTLLHRFVFNLKRILQSRFRQ